MEKQRSNLLENNLMFRFFKINKEEEFVMNVRVIRKKKRFNSVLTRIKNGKPQIICPLHTRTEFLEKIVKRNTPWIEKRIIEEKKNEEKLAELKSGKFILLFGQKIMICYSGKFREKIKLKNGKLLLPFNKTNLDVNYLLKSWLFEYAQNFLKSRINILAARTSISFKRMVTKSYKARWGCCNKNAEIFLNWKLIMLPKKIIDYVIIHELAHVKEPNHSKKFWNLVKSNDARYRYKDLWLKRNGNVPILF